MSLIKSEHQFIFQPWKVVSHSQETIDILLDTLPQLTSFHNTECQLQEMLEMMLKPHPKLQVLKEELMRQRKPLKKLSYKLPEKRRPLRL